jgi:hypothetical protein
MGRAVVGGERAGEGMGGTRDLTSGPGLPEGGRRERERGGAADRWGRAVRRGRAKLGRLGRERERGGAGAREGGKRLGSENGPVEGGSFSFSFFFFYSSFLFSISISFYLLFF